jgi:hypothetical protein
MEAITAYRAADGSLHATEEMCEAHEMPIKINALIDRFVADPLCPYSNPAHVTIARKAIHAWEQWMLTKDTE